MFFLKKRYIISLTDKDGIVTKVKIIRARNIKEAQKKALNFFLKNSGNIFFHIQELTY